MKPRCGFGSVLGVALTALSLVGCSKPDGPSIVGHWRAERVQVLSAHLPIGPDFMVSEHELASPDAEVRIPIEAIETKRNEAIVDFAYGVGLSFYFDGPDRMYVEVPLAGKLYYRRIKDGSGSGSVTQAATASRAASTPPAMNSAPTAAINTAMSKQPTLAGASTGTRVQAEPTYKTTIKQGELSMSQGQLSNAETLLMQASAEPAAHPAVDYDLALLKIREADPDAAIRHLGDAFARGFRGFDIIDRDRSFDAIRSDVRFTALVSRYR
jgi:hypothetical protein